MIRRYSLTLLVCLAVPAALWAPLPVVAEEYSGHYEGRSEYNAPFASRAPVVDGVADEAVWERAAWREIDVRWLGPEYTPEDYSGRFKVAWTADRIYLLTEIVDDTLIDTHRDPLVQYWDDDTLEIFIDEDFSGGEHKFNHNAFAYHMSLDNQAIDLGTEEKPVNLTHHTKSAWKQTGNKIVWEVAIDIYDDTYVEGAEDNEPLTLTRGKTMGLMVAYCDNDGSELRENFIGSETVPSGPTDRGYIDAGLFGKVVLTD